MTKPNWRADLAEHVRTDWRVVRDMPDGPGIAYADQERQYAEKWLKRLNGYSPGFYRLERWEGRWWATETTWTRIDEEADHG